MQWLKDQVFHLTQHITSQGATSQGLCNDDSEDDSDLSHRFLNERHVSCVHTQILETGNLRYGAIDALLYYKGLLCTGHPDGSIRVWDIKGQIAKYAWEVKAHKKQITCVALFEPGDNLLTGSSDKNKVNLLGVILLQMQRYGHHVIHNGGTSLDFLEWIAEMCIYTLKRALSFSLNFRKFFSMMDQINEVKGTQHGTDTHLTKDILFKKNYMRTDPSYLVTLSHTHSGWIFGAIAELVDNSRDAKALSDIVRMLSFGHKQPDECNRDYIGRFGIGFKSGAMRLGQDALILTQNDNSRSVALLSQSYNKRKDKCLFDIDG
ncbi:hypothetical protein H6P81_020899 [Aristolochia fimbriata]|uniref:Uncharacterized protein n=1 Tax=Aristolochia fimbriata TaxID=158543 RepID=A0AAV7DW36_ARIFI|nr:hypothetical protein H6P81_020899 [Aristolochia fimbriata]